MLIEGRQGKDEQGKGKPRISQKSVHNLEKERKKNDAQARTLIQRNMT